MPTTLPERRQTEVSPSLRFLLAIGAAMLVMIALMAYHARFKAWVSDTLRAELVTPDTRVGSRLQAFTGERSTCVMSLCGIDAV
jgi:hypothetical protein